MAEFDITPQYRTVPGYASWTPHPANDMFGEQYMNHLGSITNVEREHRMNNLNPIDVYGNSYQNTTLQKIKAASWPLRSIVDKTVTVPVNPEWLTYWELYYRTIISTLQTKILLRKKAAAHTRKIADPSSIRTDMKYRSFHIADDNGMSIRSIQKALNRVEFLAGAQITHEYMATYTTQVDEILRAKDPSRWTMGIDGEGRCTVGNMRAWKNKIATTLKAVDIIVSNASEDTANVIAFTLINLALGGTALLYLPKIADAATVSMIHLFSNCFDVTKIYHMVATDRMYITGEGFLDNINAKQIKILYDFCESIGSTANTNLFSTTYINGDEFIKTNTSLHDINNRVYAWRIHYYDKMFNLYEQINKSRSAKVFDGYIDKIANESYEDQTDQWIRATNFVFVTE